MTAWDKAKERADQAGQGGDFIRLTDDGDSFVGVFLGEPHVKDIVWNEKKEQYEDYNNDHKAAGKTPSAKFTMNVLVLSAKIKGFDLKEPGVKVFDMNSKSFKDLVACREKYGLEKWSFEVKRNGKKNDSKTTYSILPEKELDASQKKLCAEAKLIDLEKAKDDASTDMSSHDKKEKGSDKKENGAAAGPITSDQAQALINRLKPQPRDKIDAFLKKFGVTQVKLLKSSDLAAATAMLDEFEGKNAQPAAEEDPFA